MRIILLQDIDELGKKYEVKEVKNGYARNFLLPNKMAKLATKKDLDQLEKQKEAEELKSEEELKVIQKTASIIEGQEITISVKVGEQDQLFESITPQKISEDAKKLGFNIKKDQIELTEPIKELGEFPIKIKFEHNLEAEIKIIVTKKD